MLHPTRTKPCVSAILRAASIIGIFALTSVAGWAEAGPDNSNQGPDQSGRARQICKVVIQVQPGEEQFDGCVSSLMDSLRNVGRNHALQLAHDDCLAKELGVGSSDFAECVSRTAEAEPAQSSRSYFTASPEVVLERERMACAQLGFEPATRAFASCFGDLSSTLRYIDHSAD